MTKSGRSDIDLNEQVAAIGAELAEYRRALGPFKPSAKLFRDALQSSADDRWKLGHAERAYEDLVKAVTKLRKLRDEAAHQVWSPDQEAASEEAFAALDAVGAAAAKPVGTLDIDELLAKFRALVERAETIASTAGAPDGAGNRSVAGSQISGLRQALDALGESVDQDGTTAVRDGHGNVVLLAERDEVIAEKQRAIEARDGQLVDAKAEVSRLRDLVPETIRLLSLMRSAGWSVAVHNDYRQQGRFMTFWLFTRDDRCVKGEGSSDLQAIRIAVESQGGEEALRKETKP